MMENYQIDINKENKKTDDIYNIATEILKNAHRIAKVQTSSKDITEVIQNYDREKAIILIAQYINKYKNILNFLSKFTGRYIIYEPNFYIDKSDEIILCDLKYIRNVIYVDEIKNAGILTSPEVSFKINTPPISANGKFNSTTPLSFASLNSL